MPKKTKTTIKADDINVWAAKVVEATTGIKVPYDLVEQEIRKIAEEKAAAGKSDDAHEPPKNTAAVALGRLGGLKGGKARAEALSAKERSKIAKAAAKKRWKRDTQIRALVKRGKTSSEIAKAVGLPVSVIAKRMAGPKGFATKTEKN